jgi:hypothetical protein
VDITVELERGSDGHWVAEVLEIPGIVVHGATKAEAATRARELARRKRPGTKGAQGPAPDGDSQTSALAALEAARVLQAELLAERGGKLFEPSWKLLDEIREERSRQLP